LKESVRKFKTTSQKRRRPKKSGIDADGYRANVGILLVNDQGQLFWCKRIGMDAWQFPQGGIRPSESVTKAMYRELLEETGLLAEHVEVIGRTDGWLKYQLPERFIRRHSKPVCIGQKQIWFLLKLIAGEHKVDLNSSNHPEFDFWCWIDYWEPVSQVVEFKKDVYEKALTELAPLI